MNQGVFGFSDRSSRSDLMVAEFESSGTYVVPPGVNYFQIIAIGGGGGGGSGRRGASGTATYGGGGGSCGSYFIDVFSIGELGLVEGSALRILIGSGTAGGAARTTDDTSGATAGNGGDTAIYRTMETNPFIVAPGGIGGEAGSATTGNGGNTSVVYACLYKMRQQIGSPTGSNLTNDPDFAYHSNWTSRTVWSPCAAAGGGISTLNNGFNGGDIIWIPPLRYARVSPAMAQVSTFTFGSGSLLNSAAAGTSGLEAFQKFGSPLSGSRIGWGHGGAGGGAGRTAAAGAGGDGYRGGGGGGGGASRNGFNSGAGGRGGDGYCCIIAWR